MNTFINIYARIREDKKKKISEFMSKIYNRFLYVYILQMYLWPKSLEMVFSNSLPCQKEILIHQEFIKTRIFYKRFIKTCVLGEGRYTLTQKT